jgi:hypothetical protein
MHASLIRVHCVYYALFGEKENQLLTTKEGRFGTFGHFWDCQEALSHLTT